MGAKTSPWSATATEVAAEEKGKLSLPVVIVSRLSSRFPRLNSADGPELEEGRGREEDDDRVVLYSAEPCSRGLLSSDLVPGGRFESIALLLMTGGCVSVLSLSSWLSSSLLDHSLVKRSMEV